MGSQAGPRTAGTPARGASLLRTPSHRGRLPTMFVLQARRRARQCSGRGIVLRAARCDAWLKWIAARHCWAPPRLRPPPPQRCSRRKRASSGSGPATRCKSSPMNGSWYEPCSCWERSDRRRALRSCMLAANIAEAVHSLSGQFFCLVAALPHRKCRSHEPPSRQTLRCFAFVCAMHGCACTAAPRQSVLKRHRCLRR